MIYHVSPPGCAADGHKENQKVNDVRLTAGVGNRFRRKWKELSCRRLNETDTCCQSDTLRLSGGTGAKRQWSSKTNSRTWISASRGVFHGETIGP